MMWCFLTILVPRTDIFLLNLGTKCLYNTALLKTMKFISHPNSTDNTFVFSIFEAKDNRNNVKIGLTRFQEQINAFQTMKWW